MAGQKIESALTLQFKRPMRAGRHTMVVDLFATTARIVGTCGGKVMNAAMQVTRQLGTLLGPIPKHSH